MGDALKAAIIANQDFPAPDVSIQPIARAVESESDNAPVEVIFRHAACDVGVMMLNADALHSLLRQRPARGKIIGMQVIGEQLGFDFQDALEPATVEVKNL